MILEKGPNFTITRDEQFCLRPDRYSASFDIFHKTHCLDELMEDDVRGIWQNGLSRRDMEDPGVCISGIA